MSHLRDLRVLALTSLVALLALARSGPAIGELVELKNGIVYRGSIDRDNTLVYIFDGLKRVVVRDSKIAKIEPDTSFGHWEVFKLKQPLIQHTGAMPKEAVVLKTTAWNDRGRRNFSYLGSRTQRPVTMEQAIYELGPYLVKIRGVDGFWQEGRMSTTQVPRDVVLGLLAKVDQKNLNERRRVASFLIQAGWYAEAKRELDALIRDFPDDAALRETIQNNARVAVSQLEGAKLKAEIDVRRKAQQYQEVANRLKSFPSKDISSDLLVKVREELRTDAAQAAADKSLSSHLRKLADRLPAEAQKQWKSAILEVLGALNEAPDAVRDRFIASQKARLEGKAGDEAQFALAMSGYVVGSDAAVASLDDASTFWKARDLVRDYLASEQQLARGALIDQLEAFTVPDDPEKNNPAKRLDMITRLAVRMPPPLGDDKIETGPKIRRVKDDPNETPTEYAVLLPPEYHPLRSYPTVVALHDGHGPESALAWWAEEAKSRGYIVIAPEYNLPGQPKDYRYTTSEHAAVELAIRDAKRRYAIDSDRVYVGGQLLGGNMAWDFGLAHPDLFAGVVVISGLPFKYVYPYLRHTDKLPLYVALGDLAPASTEVVFERALKPLITRANDVTYAEHYRRALEDLPEEAPVAFDWMDRRHRDPYPKSFEVVTARESDQRFYGVVVREFLDGQTTAPEGADPFGANLHPASISMTTSSTNNWLRVQTKGIKRLDVWVNPKQIDFKRKLEVRVNNKPFFKGLAKPTVEPLLEDLRIRGDRQQVYWLKVSAG